MRHKILELEKQASFAVILPGDLLTADVYLTAHSCRHTVAVFVANEDVRGLEVAVHHSGVVAVLERLAQLLAYDPRLVQGQGPFLEEILEAPAVDEILS